MTFGQVGFAPYTSKPCVHKITNLSPSNMFVVNVEVLEQPPISQTDPLEAPSHSLVCAKENCRVYKLCLQPGESTITQYRFFYVRVVLKGGLVQNSLRDVSWNESLSMGDTQWKEPCCDLKITNMSDTVYEAYVCELI
jgi:hypothetical protein